MLCVLLFELLSYLNSYYYAMFALIEVLVLIYKWTAFQWYAFGTLAMELAIQVLSGMVEIVRIFLGSKGVRSHQVIPLLLSVLLCAPAILSATYFMMWQSFVTKIERILCIVQVAFVAAEALLGLACIVFSLKNTDY